MPCTTHDAAASSARRARAGARAVGGAGAGGMLAGCADLGRYPDLIVADRRPAAGASGVDAVMRIRKEVGSAIPALVISGDTGSAAESRVLNAGFALLPKPVVAATLKAATVALLAAAHVA